MKGISIIIPTRNRSDILAVTLPALLADDWPGEVIIADDGSVDGTAAVVGRLNDRRIRYLPGDAGGSAVARNRGARAACEDILLFLDDDLMVPSGTVRRHLQAHDGQADVVARGPVVWVNELAIPEHFKVSIKDIPFAFFSTNVSLRRQTFTDAGGFDEHFSEYGWEDLELGHRLRCSGCRAAVLREAPVFHLYIPPRQESMPGRLEAACRRAMSQGRTAAYYFQKHPHWRVALSTRLNPANMILDRILSLGGWCEFVCRLALAGRFIWRFPSLSGLALRLVSDRFYFAAARDALAGYAGATDRADKEAS